MNNIRGIKSIILLLLSFCANGVQGQEITNVHIGNDVHSFYTNDIDSITFDDATATKTVDITKKAYEDCFTLLKDAQTYKNFIYCDFNLFKDTVGIQKVKTQCGQILSFNGDGNKTVCINNGKMHNEKNFRMFGKLNNPVKYIGMKYSYTKEGSLTGKEANEYPPCVLLLGQNKDPWAYIIHILFYQDKIQINTKHGEGFVEDCILLEGDKRINPSLEEDKTYEVSAWIDGDTLYIKKPNGDFVTFQNDYFKEDFNYACWQVWNLSKSNIKGSLSEIYAGDKAGLEAAYRAINGIRE